MGFPAKKAFPIEEGEEGFISNPATGAIPHCRGIAVDLTLTDENGDKIPIIDHNKIRLILTIAIYKCV